jgi:hypothetical protein
MQQILQWQPTDDRRCMKKSSGVYTMRLMCLVSKLSRNEQKHRELQSSEEMIHQLETEIYGQEV